MFRSEHRALHFGPHEVLLSREPPCRDEPGRAASLPRSKPQSALHLRRPPPPAPETTGTRPCARTPIQRPESPVRILFLRIFGTTPDLVPFSGIVTQPGLTTADDLPSSIHAASRRRGSVRNRQRPGVERPLEAASENRPTRSPKTDPPTRPRCHLNSDRSWAPWLAEPATGFGPCPRQLAAPDGGGQRMTTSHAPLLFSSLFPQQDPGRGDLSSYPGPVKS